MEQPWLDEASKMNPYTYNITMNVDTAKRKGLKDKDLIEIESSYGHKVKGTLKLRRDSILRRSPSSLRVIGQKGSQLPRAKDPFYFFIRAEV